MMYKVKGTVCSESHTKHTNANAISMQNVRILNMVVRIATGGL